MIKVTLTSKQRIEILYAIRHHAKGIEHLVTELVSRSFFSRAKDAEWGSWSTGPNSNYLKVNGLTYYLSGDPFFKIIEVRTKTKTGKDVDRILWTRLDVNRFCDEIGI